MANKYHRDTVASLAKDTMALRQRGIANLAARPSQTDAYFNQSVDKYLKKTNAYMGKNGIIRENR